MNSLATSMALGDAFTGENARLSQQEMFALAGIAVGILLLVWFLYTWSRRQDHQRTYRRPNRLFGQLCAAHRLTRSDRNLLKRLAEHWQLAQPALLFVQPERFAAESLPAELADASALGERLFAEG